MSNTEGKEQYLIPATFIDSDHPRVIEYTQKHTDDRNTAVENAVQLYYAVRDEFRYSPYKVDLRPEAMKASNLLTRDYGYCIEKACLLAACTRVIGIPSRLCFANVKNHIATERLEEKLGSNVLIFHGYTELFLEGKWVKVTPAFNRSLCDKLGVAPLEFNGKDDSIFQEYDEQGGQFMEYLHYYGHFNDIPRDLFIAELEKHYPHVFGKDNTLGERYVFEF